MRGLIRDCFENNHVCTWVLAPFPHIAIPIHGKRLDNRMGCSDHVEIAFKTSFDHENLKNLY